MNIYIRIGSTVVLLALVFYTLGFVNERKIKTAGKTVLLFYTLGLVMDVTATGLMIKGATHLFSIHGLIGYTSLTGMIVEVISLWRFKIKKGMQQYFPQWLHRLSVYTYSWWIIAFVTGLVLVMVH